MILSNMRLVCSKKNRSAIIYILHVCCIHTCLYGIYIYIYIYTNKDPPGFELLPVPRETHEDRSTCVCADQCPQRVSNGYFKTSVCIYTICIMCVCVVGILLRFSRGTSCRARKNAMRNAELYIIILFKFIGTLIRLVSPHIHMHSCYYNRCPKDAYDLYSSRKYNMNVSSLRLHLYYNITNNKTLNLEYFILIILLLIQFTRLDSIYNYK
jgi:hypothetical protein